MYFLATLKAFKLTLGKVINKSSQIFSHVGHKIALQLVIFWAPLVPEVNGPFIFSIHNVM